MEEDNKSTTNSESSNDHSKSELHQEIVLKAPELENFEIKHINRVKFDLQAISSRPVDNFDNQHDGEEFEPIPEAEEVEQEVEDEEEDRDEGIASSGSSTCSGEEAIRPFGSLHLGTFSSLKQPFKSSIQIVDSPSLELVSPMDVSSSGPPYISTLKKASSFIAATKTNSSSPSSSSSSTSCSSSLSGKITPKSSSTTTIRLLNTNKSSLNKQKNSKSECDTPQLLSSLTGGHTANINKLASHPYLCRLRASNVNQFERRYPKSFTPTNAVTTSSTTSNTSTDITITSSSSSPQSVKSFTQTNFNDSHRIPDIQRV